MAALALAAVAAGCADARGPQAVPAGGRAPLEVRREGRPYGYSDGAEARRQADALCGPRGVRGSIRDRFEPAGAAWVFAEGCA